ncbi:MAG: hypothetical protein IKG56_02900 [Clostridia bacterium]|nr:hypothetical protein [Clostridia bacterium]
MRKKKDEKVLENEDEKVEIKEEHLEKIAKEIDDNKSKSITKKEIKYKNIIRNILIAICIIIYFALLLFGKGKISTIDYIRILKTIIAIDVLVSIVLFEISMKKDNIEIGIHGLEMIFVGGFTVYILELFNTQNNNINIYFSIFIGITVIYYIVKSIILAIKKKL